MASQDIEHFTNEIKKTKNWSNHRKMMYGMGMMASLSITDGSVSADDKENSIIPASDRALTAQLVTELLNKLIEYGEVSIIDYPISPKTSSAQSDSFQHTLDFKPEVGIQYILNSNLWLKILDDTKQSLALVVTGNLKGTFTFYHENNSNYFEQSSISFNKNGIYRLTNLSARRIHLKSANVQLNQ